MTGRQPGISLSEFWESPAGHLVSNSVQMEFSCEPVMSRASTDDPQGYHNWKNPGTAAMSGVHPLLEHLASWVSHQLWVRAGLSKEPEGLDENHSLQEGGAGVKTSKEKHLWG